MEGYCLAENQTLRWVQTNMAARLTEVVLTPQSSNFSKVGVGALGVSMNSNSLSEPLALFADMVSAAQLD